MLLPNPRYRLYTTWNSYLSAWRMAVRSDQNDETAHELLKKELRNRLKCNYVELLPMCRVGIYLGIRVLIHPGTEVIMSPYTIADVVNMVIAAGGKPVFADIEKETCNINPEEVEKLIGTKTGAVLITHLHGLAASAEKIRELCDAHNIPLIEDAAQAFGTRINSIWAGTIGDIGVYSFGMYKNINSWYGGALVAKNPEIGRRATDELQKWPRQPFNFLRKKIFKGLATDIATWPPLFRPITSRVFRHGLLHNIRWINKRVETELDLRRHDGIPSHYKARPTSFQAQLAHSQLQSIDKHSQTRIKYASLYYQALKKQAKLTLPPLRQDLSHIYTYFPIQYHDRKQMLLELARRYRDVGAQHLKNTADLPGFKEFARDCPNAREVAENLILLPTYPRYGASQVEQTAKAVLDFLNDE
ncbi:MAG: hypothetical protein D3913_02705 [Candidatus Electrothrix sp. LOE1_4_5]|nr:hypothetical protein [Candidatus Electrothrix gigas]MCI5225596.1 hypothetical protein [Candidatus Electrothrix gigas]